MMSKELAVVVIHGMGSQASDFAEPMIEEVNDRVAGLNRDPSEIAWRPIYWANLLEARELKYFRAAKRTSDLDFVRLRKFVLTALGDASAYQRVESAHNTAYEDIHAHIKDEIASFYSTDLGSEDKPLIVMAHSLGGHIMSNYIWDAQHANQSGRSDFERMKTLSGMITFGCNIPLFTFAYENVEPIEFPLASLPDTLKKKAKWYNFYDPDDVLGYPLKPINSAYKNVVAKDIPINVGGIVASWNPMSHNNYWTDNDFTKPVSKFIASFLNLRTRKGLKARAIAIR